VTACWISDELDERYGTACWVTVVDGRHGTVDGSVVKTGDMGLLASWVTVEDCLMGPWWRRDMGLLAVTVEDGRHGTACLMGHC
jgi:hypothetical protein